ncbi:MAG: MBL fold metallo-hydrolase, partial [bacterium]|nr:MBL fold metallo-hydrolase [bacterium]
MKITFYGAAREVTGSCFLFETEHRRLLIDCGMFQGSKFADDRNHEPFPFDPKSIDALLLTHAHLDHLGRVPKLVKHGFSGPIFATKPTATLAPIMWDDALEVMRHHVEEIGELLIFDETDVKNAVKRFDSLNYHQEINLG